MGEVEDEDGEAEASAGQGRLEWGPVMQPAVSAMTDKAAEADGRRSVTRPETRVTVHWVI